MNSPKHLRLPPTPRKPDVVELRISDIAWASYEREAHEDQIRALQAKVGRLEALVGARANPVMLGAWLACGCVQVGGEGKADDL